MNLLQKINMAFLKGFILCAALFCMLSCSQNSSIENFDKEIYTPEYASGFSIVGAEGQKSTILKISNPWQGAEDVETMLFIARDNEKVPNGFQGEVIRGDADRVICMSSSYIAMLDALGAAEKIVGVSGLKFISNEYILSNKEKIADVGYDEYINFELLVAQNPDIVLLYGISGGSSIETKLKALGIPYVYIGEYVEEDPLGKAEWIIALAEIIGIREQGVKTFSYIPKEYNELKQLADSATTEAPKVMINTPYSDSWFMASTSSYIARLINDAGGNYIYKKNTSNHSLPIDLEEAALLVSNSDIWINVSNIADIDDLCRQFPKFAGAPCVQNGEIYNCDKRRTAGAGNDFWESGVINPHLILRDLIKIFHPELLPKHEFIYYRKFE